MSSEASVFKSAYPSPCSNASKCSFVSNKSFAAPTRSPHMTADTQPIVKRRMLQAVRLLPLSSTPSGPTRLYLSTMKCSAPCASACSLFKCQCIATIDQEKQSRNTASYSYSRGWFETMPADLIVEFSSPLEGGGCGTSRRK